MNEDAIIRKSAPNIYQDSITSTEDKLGVEEKRNRSLSILNHWKQAASMSKLGNRTKNLLEKWKYSHSEESNESALASLSGKPSCLKGEGKLAKEPESKGKWTEHIWSAWVHRGFNDELTEVADVPPSGEQLSDFQKDKFNYFFFHVLDHNADNVISEEDFVQLNDRMRHYMDWSVNSVQYLVLKEIHETFLDNFLSIASGFSKSADDGYHNWDPFKKIEDKESKTFVSIEEWIDVWGVIVGNARTLADLPMWLQIYPRVLFQVINRSSTGAISKSELKFFYTAFMDVGKLGEEHLDKFTHNAYKALTSNGEQRLTFHVYKLSFLNFLLGKQPNGPGQYLFGTVTPRDPIRSFPIDYSALDPEDSDSSPE